MARLWSVRAPARAGLSSAGIQGPQKVLSSRGTHSKLRDGLDHDQETVSMIQARETKQPRTRTGR